MNIFTFLLVLLIYHNNRYIKSKRLSNLFSAVIILFLALISLQATSFIHYLFIYFYHVHAFAVLCQVWPSYSNCNLVSFIIFNTWMMTKDVQSSGLVLTLKTMCIKKKKICTCKKVEVSLVPLIFSNQSSNDSTYSKEAIHVKSILFSLSSFWNI